MLESDIHDFTTADSRRPGIPRNALGEKILEIAADGGQTTYGYDALGQLTSTDGPLSGTADRVIIEYDALGNKNFRISIARQRAVWEFKFLELCLSN